LKSWSINGAGVVKMSPPLISVVDDSESVREAVRGLIRSVGYAVATFESAEDFLASASLAQTTCLILDVRMPGMDGIELQRRLAASEDRVPIVFITAHGDEASRIEAMTNGAVDYLRKPFSESALLDAVSRGINSKQAPSH
jgi:FixJ family two-component response regulator